MAISVRLAVLALCAANLACGLTYTSAEEPEIVYEEPEKTWPMPEGYEIDAAFNVVKGMLIQLGYTEIQLDAIQRRVAIIWENGIIDGKYYGYTRCKQARCVMRVMKREHIWQTSLIHEILHVYSWRLMGTMEHKEPWHCEPPERCMETDGNRALKAIIKAAGTKQ